MTVIIKVGALVWKYSKVHPPFPHTNDYRETKRFISLPWRFHMGKWQEENEEKLANRHHNKQLSVVNKGLRALLDYASPSDLASCFNQCQPNASKEPTHALKEVELPYNCPLAAGI